MKSIQILTDKAAIGLSLLCTLHCLALPVLFVLLPSLSALPLNHEAFHSWMVLAVLPTSAYALTMGCKQHQYYRLLGLGIAGLACLVLAVVAGEALMGEIGEKLLTCLGAGFIAFAHYKNYRLCQHQECCACTEHQD